MTRPMNHLETERLILRPFTEQVAEALFAILSDRDVNTFLPMFPLKNLEEAKAYIKDKHAAVHAGETLLYYAICRKEAPAPIGYVHVSGNDSHDLGYGLKKEFWHKGFCTEACQAVIGQLKQTGIPYITATHDVNSASTLQQSCASVLMEWTRSSFGCTNSTSTKKKTGCIENTGTNIPSTS